MSEKIMHLYNVIVLEHINGDITIRDMRAIDAFSMETIMDPLEIQDFLEAEAFDHYGKSNLEIYIQQKR